MQMVSAIVEDVGDVFPTLKHLVFVRESEWRPSIQFVVSQDVFDRVILVSQCFLVLGGIKPIPFFIQESEELNDMRGLGNIDVQIRPGIVDAV